MGRRFLWESAYSAQCHNHPFDRWTQNDYYSFAAFFAQIGRKQGEDYRETIVFNSGGGEMNHPVGGRVMPPKFLGVETPDVKWQGSAGRACHMVGVVSNPWFATSFANRVWAHFLGAGIVEQVDDFRVSNPASNPELLDALGKHFTDTKYNLKALVRDICNSRTYQRTDSSCNPSNAGDERNFLRTLSPSDQGGEPARHHQVRSQVRKTSLTDSRLPCLGPCRSPTAPLSTYFLKNVR